MTVNLETINLWVALLSRQVTKPRRYNGPLSLLFSMAAGYHKHWLSALTWVIHLWSLAMSRLF